MLIFLELSEYSTSRLQITSQFKGQVWRINRVFRHNNSKSVLYQFSSVYNHLKLRNVVFFLSIEEAGPLPSCCTLLVFSIHCCRGRDQSEFYTQNQFIYAGSLIGLDWKTLVFTYLFMQQVSCFHFWEVVFLLLLCFFFFLLSIGYQ